MKPARRALALLEQDAVPMRDGALLGVDVYRPPDRRVPALLLRTPYGRRALTERMCEVDPFLAVREGFAVLMQDVRGRGESAGDFRANLSDAPDGRDTVAWIRRQPWSDGRVAMVGGSYSGCVQFQAARVRPEGLIAIAPAVSGALRVIWHPGGAPRLSGIGHWLTRLLNEALRSGALDDATGEEVEHLLEAPIRERYDALLTPGTAAWLIGAPIRHWVTAGPRDPLWTSVTAPAARPLPAIHTSGWFDLCAAAAVDAYAAWTAAAAPDEPQLLTLGPWEHNLTGVAYPQIGLPLERVPSGVFALERQLAFFKAVLDGGSVADLAPVASFVLGRNRWYEDVQWPPAQLGDLELALSAEGRLTRCADARPVSVDFRYDPRDPVPTLGGPVCAAGLAGPLDQASVEERPDVVTFTSAAAEDEVELAGSAVATLVIASSAPATDFVARLALVQPDGRSFALSDGCWSGRLAALPAAGPGGRHRRCEIVLSPLHLALPPGARLRLQVTSSSLPELYPNPNTGHDLTSGPPPRVAVAEQMLLVGRGGSSLRLPVRGGKRAALAGATHQVDRPAGKDGHD